MTKYNVKNFSYSKIVGDISAEDTVINVEDASNLPDAPFLLVIERDEIIEVTEVSGNTLTVIRGKEDTEAKAFNDGAIVENNPTAGMYSGLADDIEEVEEGLAAHEAEYTSHLNSEMPHQFTDNGKTYRWGFRTKGGKPQFIYEEVL